MKRRTVTNLNKLLSLTQNKAMWLLCFYGWLNRLFTTCHQTLTFLNTIFEYFMLNALIIKINFIYFWRKCIIFSVKEKLKLITFLFPLFKTNNYHIIYSCFFLRKYISSFNLMHGLWQRTSIKILILNFVMVHCCQRTIYLFSTLVYKRVIKSQYRFWFRLRIHFK